MILCEYGCGRESKHILANGKHCCSDHWCRCPNSRLKFSTRVKESYLNPDRLIHPFPLVECEYCHKHMYSVVIKQHSRKCYLNPLNLKLCPVCGKPIKNYRHHTTCCNRCKGLFFKDTYKQTSREYHNSGNDIINYRTECLRYYGKKCAVCDETNIIEVHHLDGNHKNNDIKNLIPMCSNHHRYVHSKYYFLVESKLKEFLSKYNIGI